MRLRCPNCDAKYDVPDDVIPTGGRDVQCSDCGQTWFQAHPDQDAQPAVAQAPQTDTSDDDIPATPVTSRPIDTAIQDILREEADFERAKRDADGLESQPDLGLAPRDAREDRMARMRGQEARDSDLALAAAAAGSRRDLLPDIDEINSTLRSTSDRQQSDEDEYDELDAPRRRSGFWRGFLLILFVFSVLVCVYVFAPDIAQAVPQSDPWISAYVAWVDSTRAWLNAHTHAMLDWLDEIAASQE